MKNRFLLLIAVFIINKATSQEWQWINPLPHGNTLTCVKFVNSNTGFVVGQGCTILKTTNGGSNWIILSSGTTNDINSIYDDINSIYFVDVNNGYAVGSYGKILKTVNGGTTWISQKSGTGYGLQCVYFIDINNGYAVGSNGTILKTTDGGGTWVSNIIPENSTILVFPNPATDILKVDIPYVKDLCNTYILIYNIKGQLLLKKQLHNNYSEISTKELSKGMYVVTVRNDQISMMTKFIKE